MQDEFGELISRNYPMLRISLAYASRPLRPKLLALYGLLSTVEESLYRASDPVVSIAKLTWWYEELQQAKRGHGNHPLSLHLQASGALVSWSDATIERMFELAISRVEAAGVNNENALQQLCESLGIIHLELEAALQNNSVPDGKILRYLATGNGLLQFFRESFKTSHPNYYWVPLSDCARRGIDRLQIAKNVFDTKARDVFYDITTRILDQNSMPQGDSLLTELSGSRADQCGHWLLLSLLQRRQLLLLQKELAMPRLTRQMSKLLQQARLGDAWFAWRMARQLKATIMAGKDE